MVNFGTILTTVSAIGLVFGAPLSGGNETTSLRSSSAAAEKSNGVADRMMRELRSLAGTAMIIGPKVDLIIETDLHRLFDAEGSYMPVIKSFDRLTRAVRARTHTFERGDSVAADDLPAGQLVVRGFRLLAKTELDVLARLESKAALVQRVPPSVTKILTDSLRDLLQAMEQLGIVLADKAPVVEKPISAVRAIVLDRVTAAIRAYTPDHPLPRLGDDP